MNGDQCRYILFSKAKQSKAKHSTQINVQNAIFFAVFLPDEFELSSLKFNISGVKYVSNGRTKLKIACTERLDA